MPLNSSLEILTLLSTNPHFPTLDVEAVLDLLSEAVSDVRLLTDKAIVSKCENIIASGSLYSNYAVNHAEKEFLTEVLYNVCKELISTLSTYGMYNNGITNYKFKKVIRTNELLFTK